MIRNLGKHKRSSTSKALSLGLLSLLIVCAACKPKEATQAATDSPPATNVPQTTAQSMAEAVPEPETKALETSQSKNTKPEAENDSAATSIAGGWVNAGGACNSGAAVQFNTDGTYLSEGETGTWALDGTKLTVTSVETGDGAVQTAQGPDESQGDVGEKAVLTILSITEDTARVVLSNGSNASWTRCKG